MVADCCRLYYSQIPTAYTPHKIFAILGYIIRPICISTMFIITAKEKKRNYIFADIVTSLNTIIVLLNFFADVTFSIDSNNMRHHGTLWFVPYLSSLLLLIGIVISATKKFRLNKNRAVFFLSIVLSISIATTFESTRIAYLEIPATGSICILFYYFYINVDTYKRDSLTNLYNRRNFDMDSIRFSRSPMIIASMDLNDLKYYNDTYGHKAGDDAILSVVKYMKRYLSPYGIVYRTGGDEFMAIFPKRSLEEISKVFADFQEAVQKTPYSIACGYAAFEKDDVLDEVIRTADDRMYENKRMMKSKIQ